MAPTIVIVPGLWVGPRSYELLVEEMKKVAPSLTDIVYAPLVSTGTSSPGNPTAYDDAKAIRNVIKPLVEAGKRVVMIGHSAGGFLSGMATEDLEVGEKLAVASGSGGVERFVFITAGILPVGAPHPDLTFVKVEGGKMYCSDPDNLLYHDVSPDLASKYSALTSHQPASNWQLPCTYTGWQKVLCSYILCENDRVIAPEVQKMCADIVGAEIIPFAAGHMAMLSDPKGLAKLVVGCLGL